jgi:hypothetical protein
MSKGVFCVWVRFAVCNFKLRAARPLLAAGYASIEEVHLHDLRAAHSSNLGIRSKESCLRYSQLRMTEVEKGSMLQLIATWVSQS